jgi:hypothetical protein
VVRRSAPSFLTTIDPGRDPPSLESLPRQFVDHSLAVVGADLDQGERLFHLDPAETTLTEPEIDAEESEQLSMGGAVLAPDVDPDLWSG